jgi:hypothetical protein
MNEEMLRAMIREAVARRLGQALEPVAQASASAPPLPPHPSHGRYELSGSGGQCLIEPAVPCVHCGYCQSHGH